MPGSSRWFAFGLATALAVAPVAIRAETPLPASRVIVSSTLNHGLLVLDASTLEFAQPMLVSKGTSPIRLDIEQVGASRYLFAANHGIAGSLGIFDLSTPVLVETPASPVPTGGFGSVGVDAAPNGTVAVTNTWFALGGCSMPNGSVSIFDVSEVAPGVVAAVPEAAYELAAAIPYAAAVDPNRDAVYASTNCGDEVEIFDADGDAHARTAAVALDAGPDATLFDAERDRSYTVNIGGDSLSVVDGASRTLATTVPLPNAGPIDASLATSAAGSDWILTSNGQDDTFSIVDRDVVEACIAAASPSCPEAEVARIDAGVEGGAPEGISYDPRSGRVFVVNKSPIGAPSLSAIEVTESESGIAASLAGVVALPAIDPLVPAPAIIAFDVVVDTRGL